MRPYYYVHRVGHGSPVVKHETASEAQAESLRLAVKYPGAAFEILMCVGITQSAKASTFWMDGVEVHP